MALRYCLVGGGTVELMPQDVAALERPLGGGTLLHLVGGGAVKVKGDVDSSAFYDGPVEDGPLTVEGGEDESDSGDAE